MSGQSRKDAAPLNVELNSIRHFGSGPVSESEAGVELEMTTARGRQVFLMVPFARISALISRISDAATKAMGRDSQGHAHAAPLLSLHGPHLDLDMYAAQAAAAISDLRWLDRQLGEYFACMPDSPARRVVQRLMARLHTPALETTKPKSSLAGWAQLGYAVILGSMDPRVVPILHSFHVAEWEAAMEANTVRRDNNDGGLVVAVVHARVQYTTGNRTFVRRRLERT